MVELSICRYFLGLFRFYRDVRGVRGLSEIKTVANKK